MTANKKGNDFMHDVGIAAAGAAVGAAAVAMADPNIRKKVGEEVEELKEKVEGGVENLKEKVDDAKEDVAKKLE